LYIFCLNNIYWYNDASVALWVQHLLWMFESPVGSSQTKKNWHLLLP